ncbi:MAG: PAS domain-containing protein [Planctomycetes bacterium]|nr:PAS domain-containing protein [Planctomycetota bacterium]
MTDPTHSRHALDALPQLVWVAGPDGTLEYLNRRCAEYSGLPIDDLLGWDWGWVVHPSDLAETLRVWTAAVRNGTPHEVEQRLRRHDGEYRWFLCRAAPVRDADGTVVRWFGTCTDVDESKRRASELQSVRTMFRALVERSHDGLALVGADGTVRFANPAAARLLDFPSDVLAGTDLWGSVDPADRKEVCGWLERVIANPGRRLAVTVRFTQRGGTSRWLEVLGTNLLPDPDVRAVAVQLRAVDGD